MWISVFHKIPSILWRHMWCDSVCVVLPLFFRSACVDLPVSLWTKSFWQYKYEAEILIHLQALWHYVVSFPCCCFFFFPEKGFINLTPTSNRTIQVRSGESLTLRVDMEAYPKPHTFSWSLMDQGLRNTTDHVITTHSHEYRWNNTHLPHAPQFYHLGENAH